MSLSRIGSRFLAMALLASAAGSAGCGGIAGSSATPAPVANPDASILDAGLSSVDASIADAATSTTDAASPSDGDQVPSPSCGGGAGAACPSAMPDPGTPCPASLTYVGCTYGDSPTTPCRGEAICDYSGTLTWTDFPATCSSDSTCPAGTSAGAPCDAADICGEGDGTLCVCEGNLWNCAPPPNDGGCPPIIPNEGTCCDPAIVTGPCAYGIGRSPCLLGEYAICNTQSSTWIWQPGCEHP